MVREQLIFKPLKDAIDTLEDVLAQPVDSMYIQDSVVKRFEYTFELSWKFLQRVLKEKYDVDAVKMTRKDLFREAGRKGLIEDVELWFDFREARNDTAHAYSKEVADEVCEVAESFLPHAKKLLVKLESLQKNAD